MDPIRQALELARAGNPALHGNSPDPFSALPVAEHAKFREVKLSAQHLESTRIVAYNPLHEHGRYFDMLRTQVLQAMDQNGWQMLAITSPTAGCGKSVTSLSVMRLVQNPGKIEVVIRGRPALFMRLDELEAAWRWTDGILQGWADTALAPKPYAAGSWGPNAAIALIERDGRTWHEDDI